jgi:hypothetical protein
MSDTIQTIADTIYPALELYLECSPYVADNFDMAAFERRYGRIITYAQKRADVMRKHIDEVYGLGTLYTLKIDVPDGAGVKVNTYANDGDFEGIYSSHFLTELTPICPTGYVFDHWEMNGETYGNEIFYARQAYNKRGVVSIKLVLREDRTLRVQKIDYSQGTDCITLYNPGTTPISTLGYSLSDLSGAPRRFGLPVITLQPGEELIVYCQNHTPHDVRYHMQTDFNLSKNETLYLNYTDPSTGELTTVDEIYLPDLHSGSLYVRDTKTDRFYEVLATPTP